MDIFIKIVQLVLSLSILVICHEFGHFFFAKLFKIRVEKFYLFFNPYFSLFKKKIGNTEYGIGWLPLGGYVKIAGMIDESMDKEQMKKPAQPWEFRSKPAWQRLLVMIGGVLVNVVLAFVIYIFLLFGWGKTYLPAENVPDGVVCHKIFKEMGMLNGDVVVMMDSVKFESFYGIVPDILLNKPKTIQVRRNDSLISLKVPMTLIADILRLSSSKESGRLIEMRQKFDLMNIGGFPDVSAAYDAGIRKNDKLISLNGQHFTYYDEFKKSLDTMAYQTITTEVVRGNDTLTHSFLLDGNAQMGVLFSYNDTTLQYITKEYSFFASIPAGISEGGTQLVNYVKQLGLLFTPNSEAYKSVGSFMSIGNIFPGFWNWYAFWSLTALLSIMLAVVNILPIPALDGGHVLFLLYEIFTGKQASEKFLERAQVAGMIFLFALIILSNINDVIKFFF